MAKGLFKKEETKRLLTTLRHYNISILISTHQLQNEVSTLVRNNTQNLFLFQQNESYGMQIAYDTWGKCATNSLDKTEFETIIRQLPKHQFMLFNKGTSTWTEGTAPYPLS